MRDALRHGAAVLAHQHHRHTEHSFLTGVGRGARAKGVADLNFRHVFDAQRHHATREFHRKLRDFFRRDDTADAANDELLVTGVNDAAAGILDVLAHDARKVVHRQPGIAQLVDLRLHHNLFHIAAVSVDLRQYRERCAVAV